MTADGGGGGAGGGSIWTSVASLIASPTARTAAVGLFASAVLVFSLRGSSSKKLPKTTASDKDDETRSNTLSLLQQQQQQHQQQLQNRSLLRSRSRESFSSLSLSESKNSVAIFWDVDNCSPPSGASGHTVAQAIRKAAQSAAREFTRSESNVSIVSFKAYLELTTEGSIPTSAGKVQLHSELQGSGVSLIDTPKSGRKDVADKMMITDLLSFAIDKRPPALIVLLSGDRDFAYPLGILRNRGYEILLVVPPIGATPILEASANYVMRWRQDVLGLERDAQGRLYDRAAREFENNGVRIATTKEIDIVKAAVKSTNTPTKTITQNTAPPASITTLKGPGAPPVPSIFRPLVVALEQMRKEGVNRPLRSQCAMRLLSQDADVYKKAGATTFGDYAAVAEAAGIITLGDGSKPGKEWLALRSIPDNVSTLKLKAAEKSAAEKNAAGHGAVNSNGKSIISGNGKEAESTPIKTAEASSVKAIEKVQKKDSSTKETDEERAPATTTGDTLNDITIFYPLIEIYHQVKSALPKSEYPTVSQMTAQVTKMWEPSMRDAYERANVKTFAAYMELAEQAKIGRLVRLGTKSSVTIVHIHSKYVTLIKSLNSSEARDDDTNKSTMPVRTNSLSGSTIIVSKNKESKEAREQRELKELKENGKAAGSSLELIASQKNNEKSTLLHAHQPSGEMIHVSYFPLCNTLLTQRSEGKMTSLDTFLQGILSKHSKISHFVSTPEQFNSYITRAERDDIVTCEGNKAGKRYIRLASRLCIGEEEHNRQRREKYSVENGTIKDTETMILQREIQDKKQDTIKEEIKIFSSDDFGTEPATPQERVKFKPLVDVLVSLRKENYTEAPLSKVSSRLVTSSIVDGKLLSPGAWIQSQGYSSFVDYYEMAQKKGFIHLNQSEDEGVRRIRLAQKYEAMFFPSL